MVSMGTPARPLPAPGDEVEVSWGLTTVRATVMEIHDRPTRTQVLVTVHPGELGDEPEAVSVPLGAVTPVDPTASPWADEEHFTREVAAAVARLLEHDLVTLEFEKYFGDRRVDMLVRLTDSAVIIVGVKKGIRSPGAQQQLASYLRAVADSMYRPAAGLVVTDEGPGVDDEVDGVRTVVWRGAHDDDALAAALGWARERAATQRSPDR